MPAGERKWRPNGAKTAGENSKTARGKISTKSARPGLAPKSRPGRGASTSGLVQRAAAAALPDLSLSCEDVAKGEEGLVLSPESTKPTADHCSIRRVAFALSHCALCRFVCLMGVIGACFFQKC